MMNGQQLATELMAGLAPWNGVQLMPFCTAIGVGVVKNLTENLKFTTADVGTVPGFGMGTATGIKGLNNALMAQLMFARGQGFWAPFQNNGPGVEWLLFCQKCSLVVKTHLMANALLSSKHPAVFAGSGKVTVYSGITIEAMSADIVSSGPPAWAKERFPELATAVATGIVTEILQHSPVDSVAIAGAPAGVPVGGAGAGQGTVS